MIYGIAFYISFASSFGTFPRSRRILRHEIRLSARCGIESKVGFPEVPAPFLQTDSASNRSFLVCILKNLLTALHINLGKGFEQVACVETVFSGYKVI